MTYQGMTRGKVICGRGQRLMSTKQFVVPLLFFGLLSGGPAIFAAEYLLDDGRTSGLTGVQSTSSASPSAPIPPDPERIDFDRFVGEPVARSILQPIPEEEPSTDWATGRSSVVTITDDDESETAWVESLPKGSSLEHRVIPGSEWDWSTEMWNGMRLKQCGDQCKKLLRQRNACWTGRVDAVLMWRNAPYSRDLVSEQGVPVLNASQLESSLAAGPRFQLFRTIPCGAAVEVGYLRAFNFRSERTLSAVTVPLRPVDIFPPTPNPFFDTGTVNLGSGIQTLEANVRAPIGAGNIQFISGFRWLEWRESFSLDTSISGSPTLFDNYATNVINSLYGGQIGIDALLYTNTWLEVESVMKGGAYYNTAVSHSAFTSNSEPSQSWDVSAEPASGAFVGEIGFTGVVALTSCLDFRFGYLGYWLQSIAQPTRQLSDPAAVVANGGTVVQGVTLGLEGRW